MTLLLLLLLLLLQDRSAVFAGTFGALAIMTLISVALGQVSMQKCCTIQVMPIIWALSLGCWLEAI
jgi:putative Ca2+/H+ antiporter (TMEM165/GDT1 family)